jgi:hypothetical protein
MPRWPNGKSSLKENLLSPPKPGYNPIPPPLAASPTNSAASPKRGRGRPAGSFKFKTPPPKPVVLVDGKPRGPGRPVGSIKKIPEAHAKRHTNTRLSHHETITRSSHDAVGVPEISNPSVERVQQRESSQGVQPCQAVSCTSSYP